MYLVFLEKGCFFTKAILKDFPVDFDIPVVNPVSVEYINMSIPKKLPCRTFGIGIVKKF